MKRIKLLALLSLFVVPILGSASSLTSYKQDTSVVASETKNYNKNKLNIPNPVPEHFFRVGENYYDDLQSAINDVTADTIQVLKDYETDHQAETADPLPTVAISRSLTIDGIGDDGVMHQIIGQSINISGGVTVNFENIIINGDKKYNYDNKRDDTCLISVSNNSTLNLNRRTVIKNYKFNTFCVLKLVNHSILNINDQAEITECAAKFGVIRFNPSTSDCSEVYMRGGRIHHNSSSNRGVDIDGYVEGLVAYIAGGDDSLGGTPAKFYMYGGEICDNSAVCWDDPTQCHSIGLLFLHSRLVDVKILGGSIHDNITRLGGAVCFGYYEPPKFSYNPLGTVEIGGDAYVYDNHGRNEDGTQFDSNIYIDKPESNQHVVVSEDYPLTKKSKTGIFLSDSELPQPGTYKTVIYNAKHKDLSHFVADNDDYTMRYEGDTNHTIALYQYTETDPRFSEPVFNEDLHYNGKDQQLIDVPGKVTKGGQMLYSLDYNGVIEDAHWTSNPKEITGKEARDDYKVAYYVEAGGGCDQSIVFDRTISIGKALMEIIWPEDNFIYDGIDHIDSLKPYYVKEGEEKGLETEPLKLEDGTPMDQFLETTTDPNNRYVLTAIDPEDESLDFPEDHTRYYTMRISEQQYIDDGKIEIEVDEETNKPTVEIKSEIGYDEWTSLNGRRLDKEEDKEEYETAVKDLDNAKKLTNDVALTGIYDVTMLAHLSRGGEEVIEVVRQLDGNLKISLLLPKGVSKDTNISIYRIHEEEDGSKKVETLKHNFDKDGYVSIVTDKLSAFVIVKHLKSLLWLIILLSIFNVLLIGAIVYKIVRKMKNKKEEGQVA